MSKPKASLPPQVLESERVKHVFVATVQSTTDPEQAYSLRIILEANVFCPCRDGSIRLRPCKHLRAALGKMTLAEMREWVLDSMRVGSASDHGDT